MNEPRITRAPVLARLTACRTQQLLPHRPAVRPSPADMGGGWRASIE
jgi:hypothetical protein